MSCSEIKEVLEEFDRITQYRIVNSFEESHLIHKFF